MVALMLVVGYGYYHVTDDSRIKQHVVSYLESCTGGRVEVGKAQFKLFEGIRVEGLRIYLDPDDPEPFFEAPNLVLQHRPSALFLRRRLEPTEIVAVGFVVRLVEDVKTGRLNVSRLFAFLQPRLASGLGGRLPVIRGRKGKLIRQDLEDGQRTTVGQWPADVAVLPTEGGGYVVKLEGPEGMSGEVAIDLATGVTSVKGLIDLERLDDALPRRYRRWRQRYKLTGKVFGVGQGSVTPATGPTTQPQRFVVRLDNVSMEMPPEEGGVKLVGVCGELAFDTQGVSIRELTGRIAQAGGATFALKGRYMGYDATSGFETDVRIDGLHLPVSEDLARVWGDSYVRLHEQLAPQGPVDVTVRLCRGADGKLAVKGSAVLKGVSLAVPNSPTGLSAITGRVNLNGDTVELVDVQGRYGQAKISMAGRIVGSMKTGDYDLRLTARDLPFSRETYQALPTRYRRPWDELSPEGKADIRVHLYRDSASGQGPKSLLTIDLTGGASVCYKHFPYRVGNLKGQVLVDGGDIEIRSVVGSQGQMACVVNGWVRRLGGKCEAEVTVDITGGLLDERLARALPRMVRAEYRACGLRGRIDVTKAVFRYRKGKPLQYTIPVAMIGGSICHEELPYRIDAATGTLRITRESVTIERLVGRRGRATISVAGVARVGGGARRAKLTIEARSLTMGPQLRRALPPGAQHWWDQFDPSGQADVVMAISRGDPASRAATVPATGPSKGWRCKLRIQPRGMRIRYSRFPYVLDDVRGTVDVADGRMVLRNVTGLAGKAPVTLNGVVTGGKGEGEAHGELAIATEPVHIDEQLLRALGDGLVSILRLKPGGQAKLDLKSLKIGAGACPMPAAVSRPTTAAAPMTPWAWTGTIGFREAILDWGLRPKCVTGAVTGRMSCPGQMRYLSADARVALDSLAVGPRRVTDLSGVLTKDPRALVLKISDITGQVYGGRLAGFAEVSMTDPVKYGMNLSVENVNLAAFLNAGRTGDAKLKNVKGSLSGTLRMTAVAGNRDSLRATGRIQITRGELYKLPVLLGFLHLVHLALPSDSAFHEADVAYEVRGDKMVLQEINLRGSALSMVGAGTLDLKTNKMNLTFVAGPPRKLPRLPGLSDVIEGLASMLTTWRVTGTVDKPKMRQVPLRDLAKTLRQLHEPGR